MPRKQKQSVEQYEHTGEERVNNPPVGLVTPQTDPDRGAKKSYEYDPHLDPQLQWTGKAEHTSFDVPTVSLHVHERIDPKTIIEAVRKAPDHGGQQSLFAEQIPLREAVEFYQHKDNWSNRLVAGDSLLVMNSLLEKEAMAGKVQMVYFDPPYGIKYGSNFQPFINKRDVKDGKDEDLSAEPEMIKAFRDTWELGIHSYLSYLRDRLLLARELLHESGSVFVQISDENVHRVREIIDEVFGAKNFVSQINYRSMSPLGQKGLANIYDYIIWYAKCKQKIKFRPLFIAREIENEPEFCYVDTINGDFEKLPRNKLKNLSVQDREKLFKRSVLTSSGYTPSCTYSFKFRGSMYEPLSGKSWRTHPAGMDTLIKSKRIFVLGQNPYFRQYYSDFPVIQLENSWSDTAAGFGDPKVYVVQTNVKLTSRCILMTTDPGDLVLDITCGSGTTAFVAEQWGRRWITCDTSRVALTLAKQRLMTASFDYYKLAHPDEGVGSGFVYKTVPHITLKSIANNEPLGQETLYDQPLKETGKARITGPFTVEAVPAPYAKSLDDMENDQVLIDAADPAIARTGETLRQSDLRDELLRCGVRGKNGQKIMFGRVETLAGTKYLQAEAETKPDDSGSDNVRETPPTAFEPVRAVISFGPEHAPLEPRQVELALYEAGTLRPKPQMIIFAAFQFDPEAAKDIDETNWPGVILLKVQMNADLQTGDLKKKRSSNESFWLVGQPDVSLRQITKGDHTGKWQVEVRGFDYFNTKTGEVESGSEKNIAVWMLDTDYDGRSLYPKQVFFPMAGPKDGWNKLARNLRAEIDEDRIEAYRGAVSLPFDLGKNERIAVKIVDDRGIESLRVVNRYK